MGDSSTKGIEINTIFDGLNNREMDYVQARANSVSDAEALRTCGFSRGWLNSRDKKDLNQRALDFKTDNVLKAQLILDKNLEKAAQGLAELLESRNEYIKIKAQTEIMDRRMGKPTQKVDQKTEHSGGLEIVFGEPIPKRIIQDED